MFTDGITNKLVGCFHTPASPSSIQRSDYVILVRIYGNKTDLLIDRQAEQKNIQLLQTYGLAPTLYAVFQNGIAYEYVPGITLTSDTVAKATVWPLIARNMAEMHKVQTVQQQSTNKKPEPMLWEKFEQFLKLIPERFTESYVQERYNCDVNNFLNFPPIEMQFACNYRVDKSKLPVKELREEIASLAAHLKALNNPVVFAHNDLLLGNVIYTESQNKVTFIDYEYAAYNYQAFDIGNHFTEFAGLDVADKSRYPSKEFQLQWLRVYLEMWRTPDDGSVTRADVERLYVHVNKFALASYLFWTVWALIQAEHSTIDYDFV